MNEDTLKQILEELRQANQFNRKVSRFYAVFLIVMMMQIRGFGGGRPRGKSGVHV